MTIKELIKELKEYEEQHFEDWEVIMLAEQQWSHIRGVKIISLDTQVFKEDGKTPDHIVSRLAVVISDKE